MPMLQSELTALTFLFDELTNVLYSECGNCYVRGIGTKKDPRKAARYFRQAESLGLYTPGNTWIHKAKYDDAVDEGTASPNRFDGARRLFRRRPLRQASATQVTPAPSSPRATAR